MRLIPYCLILILLAACGTEEDPPREKLVNEEEIHRIEDSIRNVRMLDSLDVFPKINYKKLYIDSYSTYVDLKKKYDLHKDNWNSYKAFITLNRKEFNYLRVKDSVLVPDTIIGDMRAYSVFPPYYDGARDIPRIIVVSNKYQCYACYEYGRLVRFAAANTGKERTPSFPGRYALVWKEKDRRSSLDSNWFMPYTWNFHPEAGSAFHKFTMPGRPVSHSCVRQFMSDAKWLFYWGKGADYDTNRRHIPYSGTPVLIIDLFDFSRPKYGNWIDLRSNKDGWLELPEKPMEYEEALIPIEQIPEVSRPGLRNKERYIYAEDTLRARGWIRDHVRLIHSVDFNKLRREKAAKTRKDSLKKLQADSAKTDLNIIKENLEELDKKPVEIVKPDTSNKMPGVN